MDYFCLHSNNNYITRANNNDSGEKLALVLSMTYESAGTWKLRASSGNERATSYNFVPAARFAK